MYFVISYDSNSGGEREIQRTMLELLNQLDGFDSRGDVKVRRDVIDAQSPTFLLLEIRSLWQRIELTVSIQL